MVRDGKPKGFFYLDHRTVDSAHALITDIHVTPGNVHDSMPYLSRLDRQRARFGFDVRAVGLDAGYFTAGIAKGLEDREIEGVIGYRRPTHRKGYLRKKDAATAQNMKKIALILTRKGAFCDMLLWIVSNWARKHGILPAFAE